MANGQLKKQRQTDWGPPLLFHQQDNLLKTVLHYVIVLVVGSLILLVLG